MKPYDYILAGGGMAGLSLAYHLTRSSLQNKRILIVDREPKNENDRTWCFWTQEPTLYDPILHRSWEHLHFHGPGFSQTFDLHPYRYQMLRGIDFYRHTQAQLRLNPNVHFLYGSVSHVHGGADGAEVILDGERYRAGWVFDSLYLPGEFEPREETYHMLWQHFKGWIINTQRPVFTPEAATFFDFRTPQAGAMRFMYILPFSETQALVEYTLFSPTLLSDEAYDRALKSYIAKILQVSSYQVLEVESGKIPMTDQPFPRFPGPHHMTIGTKGGRVKASTGFAFLRVQQDSRAIVQSLLAHGTPEHIPGTPRRFPVFDSLMLEVMESNGGRMANIFTAMFKKNPIQRIFRFLDEEIAPWENLLFLATMPPEPFLQAMLKQGLTPGKGWKPTP
jgi:lycopene beta-cyclase